MSLPTRWASMKNPYYFVHRSLRKLNILARPIRVSKIPKIYESRVKNFGNSP